MCNKKIDVISLKVCRDKCVDYNFNQILKPNDVGKIVKSVVGDTDREYLLVINLNNRCVPNSIQICGIGTLSEALVHCREVFKSTIVSNASKIILCHTHPSGSVLPSIEDIKITAKLAKIGKFLDIPVLDHIIVAGDSVYSLMENGEDMYE